MEGTAVNTNILEPATGWSEETVIEFMKAISMGNWNQMRLIIGDGSLINARAEGPQFDAGNTLLHLACWRDCPVTVKILVEEYHADINVKNNDGLEPIQFACLHDHGNAVGILLDLGASLNTTIGKDVFLKECKANPRFQFRKWLDSFGDKVTIREFAVLYGDFSSTAQCLLKRNIDLNLADPMGGNKTSLMYALEGNTTVLEPLLEMYKDLGLLNARDDDGFSAAHYLLHPKLYGEFQYDLTQLTRQNNIGYQMKLLIKAGVDIHATINGDPDTLLINMASYRGSSQMLDALLPYYDYITESKALYYATLPVGDLKTSFRVDEGFLTQYPDYLQRHRKACTQVILKDLVNRRAFGLPIPPSERKLMDELVAKNPNICQFVRDHESKMIEGKLKTKIIEAGDASMNLYDLMLQSCNERKVKLLVKNKTLMEAFKRLDIEKYYYSYFKRWLERIFERTSKRIELLEKLEKIEQLLDVIPLPYELILDLIEYLDNQNLDNFIAAFFE